MLATAAASLHAADHLAAPQNLQVQTSGGNVFLSWRAGGSEAPEWFRIEVGSAFGLADLAIINLPWHQRQGLDAVFTASGVAPGIYHVRVRAIHNLVAGAASNEVVVHIDAAACPLPPAPRNVVATVEGPMVTLAWDAPVADGASATGYVIEAGHTPGVPHVAIIVIRATTSLSVHAPPGRYFVRLRAMGPCGASEPSAELVVDVP